MTEHKHRYVFLRQSTQDNPPDGTDLNRTIVDVYYCNRCLEYTTVIVGHEPVYEFKKVASNSWLVWPR